MPNRATPTAVAKELGIRPQIIYGLIKRHKVKAFGEHPVMVDPGEVKMVLKTTKTRVPKEKRSASRAKVQPGQILSWDKGGKRGSRVAVVTGVARSEDPDGTDFVLMHDGTRAVDAFSTEDLGTRLTKGTTKLENIPAILGMVIFQWTRSGELDKASALDEFCRQILEIDPVEFKAEEATTAQPVKE